MKTILAGAALAIAVAAAPALAAEETPSPTKKVERIVVIERGGAPGAEGPGQRIRLEGADVAAHAISCDGQKDEVNEASPDGRERTRVVLCATQLSAADRADRLEKLLGSLETRDELSAEQKARVVAALRAAIDRLRAGE